MVSMTGVPPSTLKPICPGGTTPLVVTLAEIAAVKVTDCPYTDGLTEGVTVTVVALSTVSLSVAELVPKTESPKYWAWTVCVPAAAKVTLLSVATPLTRFGFS